MFSGLFLGFLHAFETDHLVAVSSIVSSRNRIFASIKDGFYWGLGHTSTILFVGLLMLGLKIIIQEHYFHYLESLVGVMLLILGIWRFIALYRHYRLHIHQQEHTHHHIDKEKHPALAYFIGLVHGLAGSGVLVVSVMALSKNIWWGLGYLAIFGIGSVGGMMLATSILSVPFSNKDKKQLTFFKYIQHPKFQAILTLISVLLCIGLGLKIIYENILAI